MKKIIIFSLFFCSISLFAADLPELFKKALDAQFEDYGKLRDEILKSDPAQVRKFLDEKAVSDKSPILEKALAKALLEHLDKQPVIKRLFYIGRLKEEPKDEKKKWSKIYTNVRYSYRWDDLPKEDLAVIMGEYQKDECPYFILESIWKYQDEYQGVKGFNIPHFIFYAIGKDLKGDLRSAFIAAIKDRVNKNFRAESVSEYILESFCFLLYLRSEGACQDILNWAKAQLYPQDEGGEYSAAYIALCIILPAMPDADIKTLKSAQDILNGNKVDLKIYAATKKLLDDLIKFKEARTAPDDTWLISLIETAQFYYVNVDRIKPFLKSLRPDWEEIVVFDKKSGNYYMKSK